MSKRPIIVSFYTAGTHYEQEAHALIASAQKFGLDYDITAVPNRGSWSANCCFKPEFLLAKLEQHQRPLVWTDADSVFMQKPVLFDECRADVGLRINDYVPNDDKAKILTGTIFVNNTPSAKKLLQLWKKECERNLTNQDMVFDQVCLRKVILHYPTIVEIKRLPASYVYIVDNPHDRAHVNDNAVIVHYQKTINQELTPALATSSPGEEPQRTFTE